MKTTEHQPLIKKRRIFICAIILSIILFTLLSGIISVIILGTHQSFEEQEMQARMERFSDSLNQSAKGLSRTVEDYAVWDATAEYIEGKYPDYIAQETSEDSFISIDIDIIGFFDPQGNPVYSRDFTNKSGERYLSGPELEPYLNRNSPLINTINQSAQIQNILFNNGNKSGILVSRPVKYHTRDQPTGGTVVMGRYLTDSFQDELSLMLKNQVDILSPSEEETIYPPDDEHKMSDIQVRVKNSTSINAYLRVHDPVSNRYTVFGIQYPRDIYQQGITTLTSYLALIALVIIVFAGLTIIGVSFYNKYAYEAQKRAKKVDFSYNKIIEELEDAYFKADQSGTLRKVSPSSVKMLGYDSEEELIGTNIFGLFQNPDERNAMKQILFENYEIKNHPIVLIRKDGSLIFVTLNVHLIVTESGVITGMEGIAHDNTESILARKTAREGESMYRLVFESANIGLFQSLPEGKFISVNPAFASMFGYGSPEHMRQEIENIATDLYNDQDDHRRVVEMINDDGSIENLEILLKRQDGCPIWVNMNIVVIKDTDDQAIVYFGTAIDITEKKTIEKEWMENQQKFRSLFYLSPIAIMVYDPDGVLVDANSAAISLFGVSDMGILEAESLFNHPYFSEKERKLIARHQEIDTEVVINYDELRTRYQFPLSRNGIGYLHIRVTPIPHPFKRETGWFLTQITDITAKKIAEMERSISEQKYRQVFANVSHGLILFELSDDGKPGRILDMNPKAEDLVQKNLDLILESGDFITRFIPIGESELERGVINGTGGVCTFESVIDRGEIPVLIQVTLDIFRIEDQIVGLTIIEDITGKKRQEEDKIKMIHQIEKNLAELAILNDGIRNPLTIIMMMIDELSEEISKPVLAQIRTIDELINQLDRRWVESDKILRFLQKHHDINIKQDKQEKDKEYP